MERQQQMTASEQYKQNLIKQIAMNTNTNASDLKSEIGSRDRKERIGNMFESGTLMATQHFDMAVSDREEEADDLETHRLKLKKKQVQ
eukprot:5039421-Heterocapsa_arctica.AAC.1